MNLQESVSSTIGEQPQPQQQRGQPPRELLLLALNAAGAVPCLVYGDDFTFAAVDAAIEARTGVPAQRWSSEDFWDRHLHPDDRSAVEDARRVARLGWRDVSASFRVVSGESSVPVLLVGHRRANRASGRPVLDSYLLLTPAGDGAAAGPATALYGLEQSRRDLIRTSQLAVAGELVGAITHDLRQPLTALHVNLEVATQSLRQTPPQVALAIAALDDAVDDSRKLRDSVQVLQSLVSRREPIRTAVALDAIVMEVARLVQSEADARRVQLTVALARQLPPLSADASMLREAILSIVLDAIENVAPEIGAVPVRVDTKLLDDAQIELTVTHRRRPEATEDEAWALRIARSVAEAHGATVALETTATSETLVRTVWPTGPSFISGPAAM